MSNLNQDTRKERQRKRDGDYKSRLGLTGGLGRSAKLMKSGHWLAGGAEEDHKRPSSASSTEALACLAHESWTTGLKAGCRTSKQETRLETMFDWRCDSHKRGSRRTAKLG